MADADSRTKILRDGGLSDLDRVFSAEEETGVVNKYTFSEKRKIGITGSVFLILNKMIGTGSMPSPEKASPVLNMTDAS